MKTIIVVLSTAILGLTFSNISVAAERVVSFQFKVKGHLIPSEGGSSAGMTLSFPYVFVAGQEKGLGIIDVSDPSNPKIAGTFNQDGRWTRDVDVADNRAYIATFNQGLQIIDVSDPASPTFLGQYGQEGYNTTGVQVVGQTAYLALSSKAVIPVDVRDPTNPRTGSQAIYGSNGTGNFNRVLVQGSTYTDPMGNVTQNGIYAPNDTGLVYSIGASNLKGIYWLDSLASYDVAVDGVMAYLARAGRWDVVDLTSPNQPRNISKVAASGNVSSIHFVEDFVFSTDNAGIKVHDVTDPQRPRSVGSFPSGGGQMIIQDNRIYLADTASWGLWVLDFYGEILQDNRFTVWRPAEPGKEYLLESKENLDDCCWSEVATNTATTGSIKLIDPAATSLRRFYRVRTADAL